jgi:hypothetical protein
MAPVCPLSAVTAFASTKAVVASCVVLVPAEAVGAVGVPVNVGDVTGARVVSLGCTWSSRAYFVDVPTAEMLSMMGAAVAGEGTVGSAFCTKAVVASWVVLVPFVAVGAAGTPVNVGEAVGAFRASAAVVAAASALVVSVGCTWSSRACLRLTPTAPDPLSMRGTAVAEEPASAAAAAEAAAAAADAAEAAAEAAASVA